jgi:alkanesulfonate monooxygenase SsuD/methylene tetrahydromethanopterin reductase-like flavin-dependent oxidoreductase (luciferase family)
VKPRAGVYVAPFGDFASAAELASLAAQAENAGWDGFFIYDHIAREHTTPIVDPWIALAAAAVNTRRIWLGALVTPLARRRPWKVARETASLDRLSGGRLIFGAGLGHRPEEFGAFGEEESASKRATMLDEALDILVGLWSGASFSYEGDHYKVRDALFLPTPQQSPRIPIWIAGKWPNRAPFLRAAKWDGVFPLSSTPGRQLTPEEMGIIGTIVKNEGSLARSFDLVQLGTTLHGGPEPDLKAYARNGMTWWLEDIHPRRFGSSAPVEGASNALRKRVLMGPPTIP